MNTEPSPPSFGCSHYKRKCKLYCPTCDDLHWCRFCHDEIHEEQELDEKKVHKLDRHNVVKVHCMNCSHDVSPPSQSCPHCAIIMGNYFCAKCVLYDDVDKGQFHCDGCGICRVGGRDKFFHCSTCKACLDLSKMNNHKCLNESIKRPCPVCYEDMFTSRDPSVILPCGHFVHSKCQIAMFKHMQYKCPFCNQSMSKMNWRSVDLEIARTPMPEEYRNKWVAIHCNDCNKNSDSRFHILGLKCQSCGSYNTRKDGDATEEHAFISEEEDERERARVLQGGGADEDADEVDEVDMEDEGDEEDLDADDELDEFDDLDDMNDMDEEGETDDDDFVDINEDLGDPGPDET
jgi:RING finger and CHY zinc finger domain-containing protein 1